MFTWKIRIVIFRCAVHTSCVCVTVSRGSIRQQRIRYQQSTAGGMQKLLLNCGNGFLAHFGIFFGEQTIHDTKTTWRTNAESTIKTCATLSSAGRIQLWDLRHKSQCTNHVVVVVEVCNRKAISKHYKYWILFFNSSRQKSLSNCHSRQ